MSGALDSLRRDVRSAVRMLAACPGWTAAAILCLAIAAGANAAAFTIVNGLLLRALPFDHPEQLVMVALRDARETSTRPFSLREYRDLAAQSRGTGALLARTFFPLSLAADDGARMAEAELVSGNYFETLRVTPFAGRFFDEGADRDGAAPLAVLSHRLWQQRFAANADIVGRLVRVNGQPVLVAGVAPPRFVGATQLVAADLWLPAAMYGRLAGSAAASAVPAFGVVGRLATGVTIEQAGARLTSDVSATAEARGAHGPPPTVTVARAAGFGVPPAVAGAVVTFSGIVYVLMGLLMAVACANVAALVLARGAGRSREMAVRLSLGASRGRLARQLITESVVLALAGCAAGTPIAIWLTQALVARLATPFQYVSYAFDVHPDARVFACSALATAAATVLCGIAPLRLAWHVDVIEVIKQSPANGRARASVRTLHAMVALQFAVSTTLLVAAGVVIRAYVSAEATRPAFDAAGLIALTLDANQLRLDRSAGTRLYQSVMERLSALPGVTAIGLTRELPLESGRPTTVSADRDARSPPSAEHVAAAAMLVSSRFFQTLGLPLRQGRAFEDDAPARPRVAIVNEAMARRLWPDASPLGRTFRSNLSDADPIEVIGVVSNVTQGSPDRRIQPAFYQLFPLEYSATLTVVMRAQGDPGRLFAGVRRTVQAVNEELSIVDLRTIDQAIDDRAAQRRMPAAVLAIVGVLGLVLSAVGLYGVVAFSVRTRARELGIRLALGARPAHVRRLVLRQGLTIVTIGLAAGGAGAAAVTQVLRRTMFGVGSIDPAIAVLVCAVLTATGCAALYCPARWASRLEPARTLRSE